MFAKRSEMAKERLEICFECDKRKGIVCGICLCELHAKAEIPEEQCPHPQANKWVGMHLRYKR